MSNLKNQEGLSTPKKEQQSTQIKLISTSKNGQSNGKPMNRAQLFAKQRYFTKRSQGDVVDSPKKQAAKEPFKPYDLSKSPPKPLKLRILDNTQKTLDQLLIERNINLKQLLSENDYLPLECFCSSEFDFVSTEERLQKLSQEKTIPALYYNQQTQKFQEIVLLDQETKKQAENEKAHVNVQGKPKEQSSQNQRGFWIKDEKTQYKKLSRWEILYPQQNVEKWLNKIVKAVQLRAIMDSLLRFNYYVDNMPIDDVNPLQTHLQTGVLGKISVDFHKAQIDPLMEQMNNSFIKLQNEVLFKKHLSENKDAQKMFSKPLKLDFVKNKFIPQLGRVALKRQKQTVVLNIGKIQKSESRTFSQKFKAFGLASLYNSKPILTALDQIKKECLELKVVDLFDTNFVSGMTKLQDFKHAQQHYIHKGIRKIVDTFPTKIHEIIKKCLKLNKDNQCTIIDQERFKRFLEMTQYLMRDALIDCIKHNYYSLYRMFVSFIPDKIQVHNAGFVKNLYAKADENRLDDVTNFSIHNVPKKQVPFFCIMLKINQAKDDFTFTLSPKEFKDLFYSYFEKVLTDLDNISDLESRYLPKYQNYQIVKSKIKITRLPSEKPTPLELRKGIEIQDENFWIWEVFNSFKQNLDKVVEPLAEYLSKYNKYKQFLLMDVPKYLNDVENDQTRQIKQIRQQIEINKTRQIEIKKEIIERIQVGIFDIQTKEISDFLQQKYHTIVQGLIKVIANRVIKSTHQQLEQFKEIEHKIKKLTNNIEQSSQLKDYLDGQIVSEIEKMRVQIKRNGDIYLMMDEYQYKFEPIEIDNRWTVYKKPKDIYDMVHQRLEHLQNEKKKYQQEMYQQQQDYRKKFQANEKVIRSFHTNNNIANHASIMKNCAEIMANLSSLLQQSRKFNSRQILFGHEQTDYSRLQQVTKEFTPYNTLWAIVNRWYTDIDQWMDNQFETIDANAAEKFVEESFRSIVSANRYFKEKAMSQIVGIGEKVRNEMEKFKPNLPLMVALRKDGMKDRHWAEVSSLINTQIDPTAQDFTFKKILELGLLQHSQACVEIGQKASKQFNIETMLNEMWKIWEGIQFDLAPYKSNTSIVRGYDDIQAMLDEHLVNTQVIQFSAFKKPFEEEIITWYSKLKMVSDVMEEWMKCQGNWMYLQPIFDSGDISKQLPAESKKFRSVDNVWKANINLAKQYSNVMTVCCTEGLLDKFKQANEKLQNIQKSLNEYLEKKREKFARFYFLSNDDLLEILSQTKQPTAVQPHLKKVFENINAIEFDHKKHITAMYSAENQKVDFVDYVNPNEKNVQDWMNEVQNMMRMSVRHQLFKSVQVYPQSKRTAWTCSHPGQCVLNGSQVWWTTLVQQAINNKKIKEYYKTSNQQLNDLVELVRTPLTKQQKTTINALIVIDVHAKDVVQKLVQTEVTDVASFEWISQLRYYWANDDCYVKCIQTNFPYGYEYLGNTLRLVITPLTDKCYMTLMGALKLNLGGAPAGPAGTGKTESTKDLAKALAKQCVVFNCSDSMDYIMIGKFFKGLAAAGAWCCFDEFNRINIEVLSVIAQQLLILFGQKAKGSSECDFQGSHIRILPTFSVFITMNPGYAGRTQLPDNLKALFRSVAMMVPDYALIGQIMLYSFGFNKGRLLAKKMVVTFKLSSEQLSSQDHYDYGMRAVRSVINAAGLLKAASPDMDEDQLLLRALRDVNVPKFLQDDLPLFENIIEDLFPGIEKPKIDYGQLLVTVKNKIEQFNLIPKKQFIDKVQQLYDTIQVRHGLMLVGPTGGGKTQTIKVLSASMTALASKGQAKVFNHILNPKSIKMGQLYGQFNEQTHEWADGILAYMVRECVRDQSSDKHWIIFDGPVDSLWIQSMNTVLDDNKKLCLNSGQILTLTPHMTMMFEVEDLAVASPATVSRCGMVYMQPESIGIHPLIESWMKVLPQQMKDRKKFMASLRNLFTELVEPCLQFLRLNLKQLVITSNGNLVQSLMRILDCFFEAYKQTEIKKVTNEELDHLESVLERIFHYAITWSIGCTTNLEGRVKFDMFLKDLDIKKKFKIFPEQGSIYDYEFKEKEKQWVLWTKSIQGFEIDQKLSYHQIAIPTKDSVRNKYLAKILISQNFHILTLGPTGTGKSLNSSELLTSGLPDTFQYIGLAFSAQTGANQTQDTIDSKMQKRRKGYYGPPIGKKCIIFIDDLNMPKKQTYGAQPPIELIRQYLDHKGWYDRKTLQVMKLQDLLVLCTMGPPGGGRTFITNRVIRHFNILAYTELPNDIINTIFTSLLQHYFKKFPSPAKGLSSQVSEFCLRIFEFVKGQLLPTPSKSHYTFNLRDIWKVVQGICAANPKSVSSMKSLIHLWYHQNSRVYHDRLISKEDKDLFIEEAVKIGNELNKFAPVEEAGEHEQEPKQGDQSARKTEKQAGGKVESKGPYNFEAKRIIFSDFMSGRQGQNRPYVEVEDMKKLVQKIEEYLQQYNAQMGSKKAMHLVMFLDACQHITRICRIIKQPQGNVLLLGVGGSGRQSLSKIATYIMNYSIRQIQVIKNYTMRNWRQDIKDILLNVGLQNKPVSFLFVDTQIINEQMLEDINNILNSGDVANIYNEKDMEDIVSACKGDCAKKNLQPNKMNIFAMYLARVKRNIHIIMCMSPIGQAFVTRLRMFPSLINGSTIDWFSQWPEQALLGVGKGQLADVEIQLGLQGKLDTFVEVFKTIHKSVEKQSISFKAQLSRVNHVTPTIYLELLETYKRILKEKRTQSSFSISRLQNGLESLLQANTAVEEMQIELTDMQPKLQKASIETEKLMEKLTVDKAQAEEVQIVVSAQEKIANEQKAQASKLAKQAEQSVAQANASLQTTLAEVKKLKKDHLNQIKALANPPNVIRVVLGGVVILLMDKIKSTGGQLVIKNVDGKKEQDYFETAKKYLLNDVNTLMKSLLEYDKENINPALIKKLQQKIMVDTEFTLERAKTASYAIQFLYLWVKAMFDFNKVFLETEPMREKLQATQKLLAQKTAFLKQKMDALAEVNKKIKTLEETFTEKMNQKERLTNQIQLCKVKLERAKKLISGLSDEQVRWARDVEKYKADSMKIAGNCAVSAGMIAYSGPFTSEYRTRMEKLWEHKLQQLKIQHSENVNMRGFLGVPVTIQGWNIAGLPKDDTSTENGIIIDKTKRWPLMIDPQNQANKFIKNLGAKHQEGLNVVKTTEPNLMRTIELAIQFGKWVLLQGVGKDLDPSLEPILMQKVVKTGSSYQITMGEKTINYSQLFKLYMTTTAPNPHYPPEIFVKVSVINFAITPSGLEQQMLAQIVALENPQMQQKKLDIVMKNAQDKKTLIHIEDSILKALSSTGGNIDEFLKDQSLINQLSNSKKTSQEINKRVEQSKITEQQIDQTRQGYRPVAYRASLLFFCILDFANIDPMYQYSLQWFSRLFVLSVESSTPSNVLEERLQNMNSHFTYSLYENVCRSLFEKHKLLFSFVLTIKIKQGDNKIDLLQWRYLLSGPAGQIAIPDNPTNWIPENQWPDFYRQFYGTGQLENFKGIQDHLMKHSDQWKVLFDSPSPQQLPLPQPYNTNLDIFQKIIVIKSIRADKVIPCIQNYVSVTMGQKFIVAPTFDLSKCYRDSSVVTPLIFVLSSGSDPVADFVKFAQQSNMGDRYKSISLGQGQGKKAKALVQLSTSKGYWVLLQNCHLSISWMPELQLIVQNLNQGMHKDFRLWLTSMPTQSFSIPILQNSIKMTLQPPSGLRNNLLRTYKNLDEKEINQCQKPQQYKKLLFGFCLFHAIVQDRRKFGPIGWNIPYEFTNQDLTVCRKQLRMLLDEYTEIPYKVLNFLGSQINYGGRVTDDKDVRLITNIIKVYINSGVLNEGYAFSVSGIYKQPVASNVDQYIQYIQKLPLNPAPEAFGLHDNAQITNSQNETFEMLESILSVQPKTGTGTGKSREQVITEIASFVQSKTPEVFPIYEIQKKYPTSYSESMNTVLVQEVIRYNRLLTVMKENLINVKKALKGQIVMSQELELIANSLFDNQVPKLWDQKGFLSMKPLASWTQDLNARIGFLQKWIDEGTPKCFWISGFFFPQAFLTGTLQNYARKHVIAIDKLSFEFKYLDQDPLQVTEKPEDGCLVYGLYLQGARWSKEDKKIVDPRPKQLYSSLPMLNLVPQPDRATPETGIYNCPVYKVVSRRGTLSTTGHSTNFVMFFEMPSTNEEDNWIRAGVAAFLALRY